MGLSIVVYRYFRFKLLFWNTIGIKSVIDICKYSSTNRKCETTNEIGQLYFYTLSNVDDGETVPTPVTTVLSLQNLMDANKFLVLFNVI